MAREVDFQDFFDYPRTKDLTKTLNFSFSGLKTAVLYHLVKRGAYDLKRGVIENGMTEELQRQVASSLLVCISDVIQAKIKLALKTYPEVKGMTFAGGVACNRYLRGQLEDFCSKRGKIFVVPPAKYCSDNAAMISFVGGYKAQDRQFSPLTLDVFE